MLGKARRLLLWRLRNRLLVTYFFIAIVPVLLIAGMVGLTAYLLYGQLAGYLIAGDLEAVAAQLGGVNRGLSAEVSGYRSPRDFDQRAFLEHLDRELEHLDIGFSDLGIELTGPGIDVHLPPGREQRLCSARPEWAAAGFAGLISAGERLYFHAYTPVDGWQDTALCLTSEVNGALLAQVGQGIGLFELNVLAEGRPDRGELSIGLNDRTFKSVGTIEPTGRELPGPGYFFDPALSFISKFDIALWEAGSEERADLPVFLLVSTRASLLNQRIFAPLGEVAVGYLVALVIIAVLFLALQLVSMITGVQLTRTITRTVHELYGSTVRLQAGDFSARVRTRRDDQLGALCDSFNQMASSIEGLIEEQKQKQKLESEVEIARQVQEQLFPRQVPLLQTLTLAGRCVPARGVGGDYYDYGLSRPGNLVFTIGDISGKGVSAALLMASIQSLIRGQIYASREAGELEGLTVAELVGRVNRLLCANTAQEKYSTLFVAHYEDETRKLTYTNAGHLPPLLLRNGKAEELTAGGAVVGLFPDIEYEQATVTLEEGDTLVAYTDGVTEAENSYEEDYGIPRLREFVLRKSRIGNPDRLIDSVFDELEEWSPGGEASDDRTLLVAQTRKSAPTLI